MSTAQQQLQRTPLGNALSAQAQKVARASGEKGSTSHWLLEGVIYQQCADCDQPIYPAQPLCPQCLSSQLRWAHDPGIGQLLSFTDIHVSPNVVFRDKGPWRIGLVAHHHGPRFLVFLDDLVTEIGQDVALFMAPDVIDQAVFLGVPPGPDANLHATSIAQRLAVL